MYLLVVIHLLATSLQPAAFAQSISEISNGFPRLTEVSPNDGDQLNFTVEASDDGIVETVIFVYKYEVDIDFHELLMQPNETNTLFSAQLPNDNRLSGKLFYYYLATDNDGNINTEGFVFDPLQRQIVFNTALSIEGPETTTSNTPANSNPEDVPKRSVNVLYVVLGVLAVGALAGLAGDSDTPPRVQESSPVTVTTPLP